MKKSLLVFALFGFGLTIAQTPCEGGMAAGYPCDGFDLMSHISLAEFNASNGNDSWGWTDPDDGTEYAIMGLDNGTAFIDISDPVNPIYLGKLPTHTGSAWWRDIKVYSDHAFVVSDGNGNHGMQVFDLTRLRNVANPPVTFTEDAHYSGFGNAHNIAINEDTGYAYGVGTDTYSGGPHFVNIQDPLNPVGEGGYSGYGYSHDAQIVTYNGPDSDYTGREIYVGSNENEVAIIDVTDKGNPVGVATVSYSNVAYTHQGWFTEDHQYFLVGDEIDELNFGFNTRTLVIDMSDLDNPQLAFEYTGPTPASDHNGVVKGDRFYLANYTAGMRVIDLSDIGNDNIVEVGSFDTFPQNNNSGYDGAWNIYPYFESENIVISNFLTGGFYLVRESNLSINDFDKAGITIYPNPTSDSIKIKSENDQINSIMISDIGGKIIYSNDTIKSISTNIDLSSFSEGMYFVTLNRSITKKIIKL